MVLCISTTDLRRQRAGNRLAAPLGRRVVRYTSSAFSVSLDHDRRPGRWMTSCCPKILPRLAVVIQQVIAVLQCLFDRLLQQPLVPSIWAGVGLL